MITILFVNVVASAIWFGAGVQWARSARPVCQKPSADDARDLQSYRDIAEQARKIIGNARIVGSCCVAYGGGTLIVDGRSVQLVMTVDGAQFGAPAEMDARR